MEPVEPGLIPVNPAGVLTAKIAHLSEDGKRFQGFFANLRSDLTKIEYERAIREFLLLYEGEIHRPQDIRKHHIANYRNLIEKKYAPNTVLKKMSAISSLCKYLADPDVGLLDHNPCFGVNRVKKEVVKETAALTKDEVKRMFAALNPDRYNYFFNRAFISTGFYGGLRIHEICGLRRKNLGTESGVRILRFVGKRRNVRKVSLHPICNRHIDEHLEHLKSKGFDIEDPEQAMFPNLRNPEQEKPITITAGEYIFMTLLKKAGVVDNEDVRRYSSHSMRATFVTRLSELGVPVEDIQRELGHARPETTQVYIKRQHEPDKSPVFRLDY